MPANLDPIFTKAPDIQWVTGYITAANTTTDLTSGTIYLVFTADATNGGYVQRLRFRSIPNATTTATVARIWVSNTATTATAANNVLFDEITLPATTGSAVAATIGYDFLLGFALPAGYRIHVTIHTASANGWMCCCIGGKY